MYIYMDLFAFVSELYQIEHFVNHIWSEWILLIIILMLIAFLKIKTVRESIYMNHNFPKMSSIPCALDVFQVAFETIKISQ